MAPHHARSSRSRSAGLAKPLCAPRASIVQRSRTASLNHSRDTQRRASADDTIAVPSTSLIRSIEHLMTVAGCSAREASQVARGLVRANLYGHDSHGVQLAPIYVANLKAGL